MRHVADIRKEADFRCRTCPRTGLVPPTVRNNARPGFAAVLDSTWRGSFLLEPKTNTCGRIEVIASEIAVRETGIHLREHDTNIGVPLRQKPPIDQRGDGVERARAL